MFTKLIFPDGVLQWRHERFVTAAMTSGNGYGTGTKTLFTVTGDVMVQRVIAVCRTSLEGAANIAVGVVGGTGTLLAQLANATTLDANEVWLGATVATADIVAVTAASDLGFVIPNGNDIILTVGSTALTAGVVEFHCFWYPLSPGATVVTA